MRGREMVLAIDEKEWMSVKLALATEVVARVKDHSQRLLSTCDRAIFDSKSFEA